MSSTSEMQIHEQIRRRGERLLGLFFRAWAHELNNPVQAVLAGAELIELELGVPDASLAEIRERVALQSREVATEVVRVSDGIARLHALCRPPEAVEGRVRLGDMLAEANALWTPVSRHAGVETRFPDEVAMEEAPSIALTPELGVLVLVDALAAIWQHADDLETIIVRALRDGESPYLELVYRDGSLGEESLTERRSLWDALGIEARMLSGVLELRLPASD